MPISHARRIPLVSTAGSHARPAAGHERPRSNGDAEDETDEARLYERELVRQAIGGCRVAQAAILAIVDALRLPDDIRSDLIARLLSGFGVLARFGGTRPLRAYLRKMAIRRQIDVARTSARRNTLLQRHGRDLLREHSVDGSRAHHHSGQADHRQIIVRARLIELCHALHFASDGPGRPPKLRTAAEGGLFQTYGDLCSAHLAIRSSDRPDMVCMPHAAFDPLLHYYRHENFEDDLI